MSYSKHSRDNVSSDCAINGDPLAYGKRQQMVRHDLFVDGIDKAFMIKILNTFLHL